jgi:hypothetical protein
MSLHKEYAMSIESTTAASSVDAYDPYAAGQEDAPTAKNRMASERATLSDGAADTPKNAAATADGTSSSRLASASLQPQGSSPSNVSDSQATLVFEVDVKKTTSDKQPQFPPVDVAIALQVQTLARANAAQPVAKLNQKSNDDVNGFVIGQGGKIYDPSKTDLNAIPTIKPTGRPPNGETVVFVNGISNTQQQAYDAAQRIANQTGAEVSVLYNSTRGSIADYTRGAIGDGWLTNNPSVQNLSNLIYDAAKSGRELHIFATSNGAAISKDALHKAQDRLFSDNNRNNSALGLDPGGREAAVKNTRRQLGSIQVETLGPVIDSFNGVNGPKYLHYVNKQDSANLAILRRPVEAPFNDGIQVDNAGANARVIRINDNRMPGDSNGGHYLETYLPNRQGTFDDVYRTAKPGQYNDR